MMQATRFLRMLQKKTDKGFRVQTMQLLGEELPCQQSASNWCTAAGAGRASPECWGRSGQHGAGVWWGGGPLPCTRDADRGHGLCTDLIPLSLHFRNTISRTVGLNISGSWISFENVRKNVHHVLHLQYPGEQFQEVLRPTWVHDLSCKELPLYRFSTLTGFFQQETHCPGPRYLSVRSLVKLQWSPSAVDWTVPSQNSYGDAPNPSVMVFGNRAFER